MILDKQYEILAPLSSLVLPEVESLPKSDELWNSSYPCFTWRFVQGTNIDPDEWGLVQLKCYQIKDGAVIRNELTGRPVMKNISVPYDILVNPNPYPVTARPPGAIKIGPPEPMRKLEEFEDILSDGPFGSWMVVDVRSRIETEDDEEDRQSDDILRIVTENNEMLKAILERQ